MLRGVDGVDALRRLATTCAGVRADERCLLITDSRADHSVVEAMAVVLRSLGSEVAVVASEPVELPGDEPAAAVRGAMEPPEVDVIFELTSIFAGSSQARRDACARGARYVTVPGLSWSSLRPGGPFEADFARLGEHAKRLGERFDRASEFHLVSELGTDLRGSFEGRAGRPLWGVVDEPGAYGAPPDIEVGSAPVEGTAEGVVVIDGSLLFLSGDQLAAPVTLRFREGRLEDASGPEAFRLLDALRVADDPRMANLAELLDRPQPPLAPGRLGPGAGGDRRRCPRCARQQRRLRRHGRRPLPHRLRDARGGASSRRGRGRPRLDRGMSLIEDLVAIASVPAPTFAEAARVEWLEERLKGLPGRRRRDEVGNLIWEWGEGRPRVLLAAHLDTVFAADTPLVFEPDGDYLVGPGVGDNAAAVAVAVDVVAGLLADAALASGAVAFTVGEEGLGNLRGAAHACRELRPEAFVALEGHMLESTVVDAVGSVRARITVTAPGGHSWSDRGGASAIHGLIGIAGGLLALTEPEAPVNVGTIAGGRSVNTLADRAELLVECRSIEQARLAGFEAALHELDVSPGCDLEVELLGRRPGGSLDRDTELFAAIAAVRSQLGLELCPAAASTDANVAHALGVPALCIGVSRGSGMHSLGERIDLTSLPTGAAQLRALLLRLLAPPSKSTASAAARRG